MGLEQFTKARATDWPSLTIRKNGSLCLNRKAIEAFNLTEIRFVSLHFDRDESLLGIRPEQDGSELSSFKICKEKGRTVSICCQVFLKHHGIHYREGSRLFKAEWNDQAQMILVKLSTKHCKEVTHE